MIVQLDASNRIVAAVTIYPASEEHNRLEFYPNAIIIDSNLITEDCNLYEILDGHTPTLIDGWEAIKIQRQNEQEASLAILAAMEVRAQRDALLAESDWTQVSDAPVDQAAWATYRQALRDITNQESFPTNVAWPVRPE